MNNSQCDSKVFYDTEYEAEWAANRMGHRFEAEMVAYKCGTHWHTGNKDASKRSKVRQHNKSYCEDCDTYMKPSRWAGHQNRRGHIEKVNKEKEEK